MFPSTAIPGSDVLKLPAASPEQCHAMCSAHPKCTFFSFEGWVCVFDKSALRQSFYVHLSNRSFLIKGVPSAVAWSIIQMRWWPMLKTESHPGYRHVSVSRITVCISSQHVTVRKDSLSTGILGLRFLKSCVQLYSSGQSRFPSRLAKDQVGSYTSFTFWSLQVISDISETVLHCDTAY